MNRSKHDADKYIWKTTRPMWFLLCIMAVYILYLVFSMQNDAGLALGVYRMIPRMTEHLCAGCAVVLGYGAIAEYLAG